MAGLRQGSEAAMGVLSPVLALGQAVMAGASLVKGLFSESPSAADQQTANEANRANQQDQQHRQAEAVAGYGYAADRRRRELNNHAQNTQDSRELWSMLDSQEGVNVKGKFNEINGLMYEMLAQGLTREDAKNTIFAMYGGDVSKISMDNVQQSYRNLVGEEARRFVLERRQNQPPSAGAQYNQIADRQADYDAIYRATRSNRNQSIHRRKQALLPGLLKKNNISRAEWNDYIAGRNVEKNSTNRWSGIQKGLQDYKDGFKTIGYAVSATADWATNDKTWMQTFQNHTADMVTDQAAAHWLTQLEDMSRALDPTNRSAAYSAGRMSGAQAHREHWSTATGVGLMALETVATAGVGRALTATLKVGAYGLRAAALGRMGNVGRAVARPTVTGIQNMRRAYSAVSNAVTKPFRTVGRGMGNIWERLAARWPGARQGAGPKVPILNDDPLIDANILIQASSEYKNPVAREFLNQNRGLISLSKPTKVEFLKKSNQAELSSLIKEFELLEETGVSAREIIKESRRLREAFLQADGPGGRVLARKDSRHIAVSRLTGIELYTNDLQMFKMTCPPNSEPS